MDTKMGKEWMRRLEGGLFTEGQVRQWCQAVVPLALGLWPGGKRTTLDEGDAADLVPMFYDLGGVSITPAQVAKGRDWLRKYGAAHGLPVDSESDIIGFRFVDTRDHDSGGRWRPQIGPVYRTFLADGTVFEYAPSAWQSNTRPTQMWYQTVSRPVALSY